MYMQYPYMMYPYMQYPLYTQYPQYPQYPMPMMSPQYLLNKLNPVIYYGLGEAEVTSVQHALTEVALISYLMGMGYDFHSARALVEQWEINEVFPKSKG
jgi:hypothetical protein